MSQLDFAKRRQAIIERLGHEAKPPRSDRAPGLRHVTESLDLVLEQGQTRLACARCGFVLCSARENYKAHALRIDRPIQAGNPLIGDPKRFIDAEVQFRQFYCPACGGLIEYEVCRAEDPLLWGYPARRRVERQGRRSSSSPEPAYAGWG